MTLNLPQATQDRDAAIPEQVSRLEGLASQLEEVVASLYQRFSDVIRTIPKQETNEVASNPPGMSEIASAIAQSNRRIGESIERLQSLENLADL